MRVLLITGSFPPMKCGVGDYTAALADSLGRLNNINVAVLTGTAANPSDCPPNVELFPIIDSWKCSEFPTILNLIRRWNADIVHLQYPTQGFGVGRLPWLLPLLLRLCGIITVQTWHEHIPLLSHSRHLLLTIPLQGLIVVRPDYLSKMPSSYRWLIGDKPIRFIPNASGIPRVSLSEGKRMTTRRRFCSDGRRLIVYFGFIYPHKGVEQLFEIANPTEDHLVIIGNLSSSDPYHSEILQRSRGEPWAGHATVTGYLSREEVGTILAAADAVVLPFRTGGGTWNTSLHGAAIQGTFVLSTSCTLRGYQEEQNLYFARPDDIEGMRTALQRYAGRRMHHSATANHTEWDTISLAHLDFYKTCIVDK